MPEVIQNIVIALVTGLIVHFFPVIAARLSKTKRERDGEIKSLDAKTELDIARAAEAIAAGSTTAIANLLRSVEYQKQETADLVEKRKKREEEILVERTALNSEIADLRRKMEVDLDETRKLRQELGALHVRVRAGDEKYAAAKKVIEILAQALRDANITVPELNGGLPDSIRGYRWDDKNNNA